MLCFRSPIPPASVNLCPGCNDIEQAGDIIEAIGMAPGLASAIVFIGSGTNESAILAAMVSHDPLPATNSCSWYSDSGDNAVNWSLSASAAGYAEDPWVTGVGSTELITTSAGGPWASETALGGERRRDLFGAHCVSTFVQDDTALRMALLE